MGDGLISREALKAFINDVCFSEKWVKHRADYGSRGQIECILTYIDNAPTVDVIPNKEGYEMYNKGYAAGYERCKEERSQADIPRLTCFDCKFAAVCEDSGYVFCVKRKTKVKVNDIPCFSYYKPRYTN